MKYSKEFVISSHNIGCNDIAKPSVVWRYMQETAYNNLYDEKPSYSELFEKGYAFIISKMSLVCLKPLRFSDKITVSTWETRKHGCIYERCYTVYKNNELAAYGFADWALLDFVNKRILKVNEIELNYCNDEPPEFERSVRINKPIGDLRLCGEHIVRYSDIDCNGHINNTNYIDILCNYIDSIENRFVTKIKINYTNEALFKDKIDIYCAENGNSVYFETKRADGNINIRAEIELENLVK